MTQSTRQREIKDGAACDSHFDIAINAALVKIKCGSQQLDLFFSREHFHLIGKEKPEMYMYSLIMTEMQEFS